MQYSISFPLSGYIAYTMNNRLARIMLMRSQLGNVAQRKTERANYGKHVEGKQVPSLIAEKWSDLDLRAESRPRPLLFGVGVSFIKKTELGKMVK